MVMIVEQVTAHTRGLWASYSMALTANAFWLYRFRWIRRKISKDGDRKIFMAEVANGISHARYSEVVPEIADL